MENFGFNYFSSSTVNKVISFKESTHSKDEEKALVKELRSEYSALDNKLKEEIKAELLDLKNKHNETINLAKAEKEKSLASRNLNLDKSELKNVTIGINTVCKRTIKKENRDYVESIRLIKMKRVDLHLELVKLIANACDKVSPLNSQ